MSADRVDGNLGTRLREARERRGLSLKQLAATTKIPATTLESIERNDSSRLPGGLFSRAFVRTFAQEVGLDPEEAVREFQAQLPDASEAAPVHAGPVPADPDEEFESSRRTALTALRLIVVSVPVAVAVLYLGMGGWPGRSSSGVPAVKPATRAPTAADTVPSSPVVEPAAADSGRPPEAVARPAVAAGEDADVLTVDLSTIRRSWISAKVDGRVEVERLLEQGERRSLEVHRELVLTAGDAGAIAWTLNGAAARPLGKSGAVVTTRLTLANYKQFLAAP